MVVAYVFTCGLLSLTDDFQISNIVSVLESKTERPERLVVVVVVSRVSSLWSETSMGPRGKKNRVGTLDAAEAIKKAKIWHTLALR